MRARHPTTSDAYDLEPQMTCFLHHCSIGAGWSELKHGVDQWEHSGAKHGAAHGDVTLEYGCTYIYVHWIKKTASFFLLYYKHHKLVYTITFHDFGNIYRGVSDAWEI